MKNRMKNPWKILALAGLILAVIASGTAYAYNWPKYDGVTETTYSGGSNPVINQRSSGGRGPVSVGDFLSWDNTMHNNVDRPVTAYVGGITSPPFGGGLVYNTKAVDISRLGVGYDNDHEAGVAIAGPHVILASHGYQDGDSTYTINHQQMSYT